MTRKEWHSPCKPRHLEVDTGGSSYTFSLLLTLFSSMSCRCSSFLARLLLLHLQSCHPCLPSMYILADRFFYLCPHVQSVMGAYCILAHLFLRAAHFFFCPHHFFSSPLCPTIQFHIDGSKKSTQYTKTIGTWRVARILTQGSGQSSTISTKSCDLIYRKESVTTFREEYSNQYSEYRIASLSKNPGRSKHPSPTALGSGYDSSQIHGWYYVILCWYIPVIPMSVIWWWTRIDDHSQHPKNMTINRHQEQLAVAE